MIARQVGHLSNLVNDLLDVTRITRDKIRLQPEPVELGELLARVVEDHRALYASVGVRLEFAPCAARLPVFADPTRATQIVGNLLQSGAKFTGRGGRVVVSADR